MSETKTKIKIKKSKNKNEEEEVEELEELLLEEEEEEIEEDNGEEEEEIEEDNGEEEEEIEEDISVSSIRRLDLEHDKNIGLTTKAESIYKQMMDNGIRTLDDLSMYGRESLAKILKGVGENKANLIIEKAFKLGGLRMFVPLSEVSVSNDYISTGSVSLDNMLGGGIYLESSYEFYGKGESGKTQICATLSCRIQLEKGKGGLYKEGKRRPQVLYIDTEDTLVEMIRRPKFKKIAEKKGKKKAVKELMDNSKRELMSRIEQIATANGLDYKTEVAPNIIYVQVFSVEDQKRAIEKALDLAPQYNWKLIIVDSLTRLVKLERQNAYGRETSQLISNMLGNLHRLKRACRAALVCTNQVWENIGMYVAKNDRVKSYGGNTVLHNLDKRIYLRTNSKNEHLATLVAASNLPTNFDDPATFLITEEGITDV